MSQAAQQAAVAAELERWSARLRAHAPEVAAWGRTAGRSLDDAGLAGPASDALAALVARVAASVGAVGDSMEQTADLMQVRAATARTYAATWPGGR